MQLRAFSPLDWTVDVIIALGAFGFGLLQMSMSANLIIPDDFIRRLLGVRAITLSGWGIAAVALTCAPLIVRRRFPWVAFIASCICWTIFEYQMGTASLSLIAPFVALFTVAYERTRGEALIAGGLLLVLVIVCSLVASIDSLTTLMLAQNCAITVAVTLAGYALHARTEVIAAAEARADAAERTRESEAQRRVEEERVRIAREVHDITAHSLTAVNVQASAALRLVDADPAAAKDAIVAIRETSKGALDEIRTTLVMLRSEDDAQSKADSQQRTPIQGIADFEGLLTYLRRADIDAELIVNEEHLAAMPTYLRRAAYDMAREAVTNIVRHAGATRARIEIDSGVPEGMFTLKVEDSGKGFVFDALHTERHGLIGISERATALGGTMQTGRSALGGFMLTVTIPLPKEA